MSRLSRVAALPRQLAGAVRRNGVRNVLRFGAGLVARHGVARTLRYAIAPAALRRSRLAELRQEAPEEDIGRAELAAPLLAGWRTPHAEWARYIEAQSARFQEPPPSSARVHVLVGALEPPPAAHDDDWCVLLRPGDAPAASLPGRVAAAGARPYVEVVTFDMSFDAGDGHTAPVLQPGANPWLARSADVGFGRYAFRAGRLRATRGDGHTRLLDWLNQRSLNDARDRWVHIFQPLVDAAMTTEDVEAARTRATLRARADLDPSPVSERISVVICTHNRGRLVRQLVRALDDPRIAEVVVVANNTRSPPALETLRWVRERPRCRVLVKDEPFNFSRLSNAGAALTSGDRLLFLNDDITPISDDWLEPLLRPLRDPDVGVAGALLLYPDETVQHAGMYLAEGEGAGHSLRNVRLPEGDYLFYGSAPREVSAVTGAVMMVRRDLFDALNGFDEALPTFFQDVDLCLRARAIGAATIWTPLAELLHMESASMLEVLDPALDRQRRRERVRFLARWEALVARDPLHNPGFDVVYESQRTFARS